MVEVGNFWFIFWTSLYVIATGAVYIILRNKPKNVQRGAIYGLVVLNFIFHFASPLILWDDWKNQVIRMFLINICAVLVFFGPLIFWAQDKFLKPGYIYACILAGTLVNFYPSEVTGLSPFDFQVIRFYVQHILIFMVGVLTVALGHIRLRTRDIWTLPVFMFFAILMVVANTAILDVWGLIGNMRNWNIAFQWGPAGIYSMVGWMIPDFLRTDHGFIPVFWQLPVWVTFYPAFALLVNLLQKLCLKNSKI